MPFGSKYILTKVDKGLRGASVIGVDISRERFSEGLKAAKATGLNNKLFFLEGSICSLPFRDNILDKVLSVDVLEHVTDDIKTLREFRRVLKTKGFMVLHVLKEGARKAPMCLFSH